MGFESLRGVKKIFGLLDMRAKCLGNFHFWMCVQTSKCMRTIPLPSSFSIHTVRTSFTEET